MLFSPTCLLILGEFDGLPRFWAWYGLSGYYFLLPVFVSKVRIKKRNHFRLGVGIRGNVSVDWEVRAQEDLALIAIEVNAFLHSFLLNLIYYTH